MPCKLPALKEATIASSEQRLCMLQLMLNDYPQFEIDTRELSRPGPSYMVDSLNSFRNELGNDASITLLLGMDAFIQLPEWHCYEQIFSRCHLLVMKRKIEKDVVLPEPLSKKLLAHEVFDKSLLLAHPFGSICLYDAGQYPISSSWLKSQIPTGRNLDAYLPAPVLKYIQEEELYLTPVITSAKTP